MPEVDVGSMCVGRGERLSKVDVVQQARNGHGGFETGGRRKGKSDVPAYPGALYRNRHLAGLEAMALLHLIEGRFGLGDPEVVRRIGIDSNVGLLEGDCGGLGRRHKGLCCRKQGKVLETRRDSRYL